LIERCVQAAVRLHGDDTTVPIPAKGRSVALFYPSRDRAREHRNRHLASYAGIMQVDAFDGYSRPYLTDEIVEPLPTRA
jgi:transposase